MFPVERQASTETAQQGRSPTVAFAFSLKHADLFAFDFLPKVRYTVIGETHEQRESS
jgi:hypothetical protein